MRDNAMAVEAFLVRLPDRCYSASAHVQSNRYMDM
jgi:hypothetical protein